MKITFKPWIGVLLTCASTLLGLPNVVAATAVTESNTRSIPFGYSITASGTATAVAYPPVPFNWRVDASAEETWTSKGSSSKHEHWWYSGTPTVSEVKEFVPTASGAIKITYSLSGTGGDFLRLANAYCALRVKNGAWLFQDQTFDSKSATFSVAGIPNQPYQLYIITSAVFGGNPSAIVDLTYKIETTILNHATQTASDSGSATIAADQGQRVVANFNASPRASHGGAMGPTSYAISANDPRIAVFVSGGAVLASTTFSQLDQSLWTKTFSGDASLPVASGIVAIAKVDPSLRAPNGDSTYSVTTSVPEGVEAFVENGNLLARLKTAVLTPPSITSQEFIENSFRIHFIGASGIPYTILRSDQVSGAGTSAGEATLIHGKGQWSSSPVSLQANTGAFFQIQTGR